MARAITRSGQQMLRVTALCYLEASSERPHRFICASEVGRVHPLLVVAQLDDDREGREINVFAERHGAKWRAQEHRDAACMEE